MGSGWGWDGVGVGVGFGHGLKDYNDDKLIILFIIFLFDLSGFTLN